MSIGLSAGTMKEDKIDVPALVVFISLFILSKHYQQLRFAWRHGMVGQALQNCLPCVVVCTRLLKDVTGGHLAKAL